MKIPVSTDVVAKIMATAREDAKRRGRLPNSNDMLIALLEYKDDDTSKMLRSLGLHSDPIRKMAKEEPLPPLSQPSIFQEWFSVFIELFRPPKFAPDFESMLATAVDRSIATQKVPFPPLRTSDLAWGIFHTEDVFRTRLLKTLKLDEEDVLSQLI